jgi:LysR family glycine cleavage system transcriptional activator
VRWFREAGIDYTPDLPPIVYNDAAMYLQQAVAGEGIVLTRRSLAEPDLVEGRLVRLFDIEFASEKSYYLVCLPERAGQRKIVAFREWICAQIDWQSR